MTSCDVTYSLRILAHLYGQRRNNCKSFHSSTAHIYDVPITTYYFGGLKEMHCEKIETLTIISRSSTIMPGLITNFGAKGLGNAPTREMHERSGIFIKYSALP